MGASNSEALFSTSHWEKFWKPDTNHSSNRRLALISDQLPVTPNHSTTSHDMLSCTVGKHETTMQSCKSEEAPDYPAASEIKKIRRARNQEDTSTPSCLLAWQQGRVAMRVMPHVKVPGKSIIVGKSTRAASILENPRSNGWDNYSHGHSLGAEY